MILVCLFLILFIGKFSKKAEMYCWTLLYWYMSLSIKMIDSSNLDFRLIDFWYFISWMMFGIGAIYLLLAMLTPYWSNIKCAEMSSGDKNEVY
jgi:hypothetical protein